MNENKLYVLEDGFLDIHPLGFSSPEIQVLRKKHNVNKLADFVKNACSAKNLESGLDAIEDVVKVVTRSSMVSVFEKMKFRDIIKGLSNDELFTLLDGIYENIHGDEEKGFNLMKDVLTKYKIAKWPILTVFRCYYYLDTDLLIKPTTVKKIIKHLEIVDIAYSPTPTFDFYNKYRAHINTMKKMVDPSLAPNNPAFSGFLMMTIK